MSLFERQMGHVGRYRLISSDNPWAHDNYGQAKHGSAKANYDEMPLEDMCRMPVRELAHPAGALLFLWCTGPQAADGAHVELANAWGFTLTTRVFAWVKHGTTCAGCGHLHDEHDAPALWGADAGGRCRIDLNGDPADPCPCSHFAVSADFGPGSYTGGNVEDVWLGVRGDTPWSKLRARRDVRQVLFAPAPARHSEKPEAMQDRIEALWPNVDPTERLELFARRRRPGWACWGGQCPEPDLVFGEAVGAWWPVTKPAARPEPAALFTPEQLARAEGA